MNKHDMRMSFLTCLVFFLALIVAIAYSPDAKSAEDSSDNGMTVTEVAEWAKSGGQLRRIAEAYLSGVRDGINFMVIVADTENSTACISTLTGPNLADRAIATAEDTPKFHPVIWMMDVIDKKCPGNTDDTLLFTFYLKSLIKEAEKTEKEDLFSKDQKF